MEIFKQKLEKSIPEVLQISNDLLDAVVKKIIDIGVVNESDLLLVQEIDLKEVLKPVQIRKLLKHWNSNVETSETGENVTKNNLTACITPTHKDPSAVINCNWAKDFDIPWHAVPVTLMKSLEKGIRPHPSLRRSLVRLISDHMHHICNWPGINAIRVVAEKVVCKYPQGLSDNLCGDIVGSGSASLARQIQQRIENMNRVSQTKKFKRKAERNCNQEAANGLKKRAKKVDNYGCTNWNPPLPDGESGETQKDKKEKLAQLFKTKSRDNNVQLISVLMKDTFFSQRTDINHGQSTQELLENWPYLYSKEGLLIHFQELVGIQLDEKFLLALSGKGTRVIECLKKKLSLIRKRKVEDCLKEIQPNEINGEAAVLVSLIMGYFKEKTESLMKIVDSNTTKEDVEKSTDLPSNPCLIVLGESVFTSKVFMLSIDGIVVNENIATFVDGFLMMFATYYVFSMKYPECAECTLEFIQRCFLGINSRRGSHMGRKKQADGVSTKVLTLLNVIADYEWPQ